MVAMGVNVLCEVGVIQWRRGHTMMRSVREKKKKKLGFFPFALCLTPLCVCLISQHFPSHSFAKRGEKEDKKRKFNFMHARKLVKNANKQAKKAKSKY
jgi:hypothetical protein